MSLKDACAQVNNSRAPLVRPWRWVARFKGAVDRFWEFSFQPRSLPVLFKRRAKS